MKKVSLEQELKGNAYPGRGIVIGRSKDGTKAVAGYFIMGRSQNSRNRVFVEEGEGIRTQAFDPSKLEDPSLIIYAPVRVLGPIPYTKDWGREKRLRYPFEAESLSRMHRTTLLVFPV